MSPTEYFSTYGPQYSAKGPADQVAAWLWAATGQAFHAVRTERGTYAIHRTVDGRQFTLPHRWFSAADDPTAMAEDLKNVARQWCRENPVPEGYE